ncbi:MAG: family 43 glycosylhydrolase [Clostridia bacterium]|nr:family 43 glycosylhydrolase [Clostridia bacterium]
MKKTLLKSCSIILAVAVLFVALFSFVGCAKKYYDDIPVKEGYLRTADIRIRDISVVVHEGKYYMYGMYPCSVEDGGYACYVSEDLQYWDPTPHDVFLAEWDESFEGTSCFWAPEVHKYNDKFYLFGTYLSPKTGNRGTGVFVSDSPLGEFKLISDGHMTPHEWNCIDATFYIDDDGQPWTAFVHEWVDEGEGSMCVAKLSDDLTHIVGDVKTVFYAKDPLWSNNKVTDAPYFYKTNDGRLLMLWSNSDLLDNYAVGIAYSTNGKVDGKWKHQATTLYSKNTKYAEDGGHPVVFEDMQGNLVLGFHSPGFVNDKSERVEHACFYKLKDTGKTLKIIGQLFNP